MCGWLRLEIVLASRSNRCLRVGGDVRGQHLDGDGPLQAGVGGLVDFAHPAGTDGGLDLIRAETGRDGRRVPGARLSLKQPNCGRWRRW